MNKDKLIDDLQNQVEIFNNAILIIDKLKEDNIGVYNLFKRCRLQTQKEMLEDLLNRIKSGYYD